MKSKIIKVLIIASTKFELDGITNVILNYYRAMDKADMQIDFVIPNYISDDLKAELESFGSNIFKISNRTKYPISYISKLTKLVREKNYNIVHAHGNSCTLALEMYSAKKGNAKVRIAHSHNTKTKYRIVHKLLRRIFDASYTQAFACGQKAGEWLYNGKKFEIINNGIDINKYKYNAEIRQKYRNKYNLNGKKVIGHIGYFCYQKNHEYLIDIFAELFKLDKNYRLILIGDGELRVNIENKIKKLGLYDWVVFTGKTLDVPQFMQAMDMIVMPSRFEGLPLTLVEAQSACLQCFVSDSVSKEVEITDLVQFIALEKSPKEWANQINNSIPVNRGEIASVIYNKIVDEGFNITDNAKIMKALYNQYIEQVEN
ncbi:glycosyltransferase family 1 protein [Clostridium sp.]|uniref:glycosyltransferase family 1 protein n=1 Tax=Clostridium sp. TaxID=1506 RepID=UPI003D6D1FB5